MKNFKLETVKISRMKSLKIKLKLYSLIFKKNMKISKMKVAIPVLMLFALVFGVLSTMKTDIEDTTNISQEKNIAMSEIVKDVIKFKKEKIAQNMIKQDKYDKYRTYAMVRENTLRF